MMDGTTRFTNRLDRCRCLSKLNVFPNQPTAIGHFNIEQNYTDAFLGSHCLICLYDENKLCFSRQRVLARFQRFRKLEFSTEYDGQPTFSTALFSVFTDSFGTFLLFTNFRFVVAQLPAYPRSSTRCYKFSPQNKHFSISFIETKMAQLCRLLCTRHTLLPQYQQQPQQRHASAA